MYYDSSGHLALSTVIILGLIGIGAVVGVGSTCGGLVISLGAVGQIALAGTLSITAIGTIGATYMFTKNKPENNRKQNEQVRSALRKLGKNPNDGKIKDKVNLIEGKISIIFDFKN